MNVLFVPNLHGVISHGVPLLALSAHLPPSAFATKFLIRKDRHDLFRTLGASVLDIAHEGLRTEMVAYHHFKPDVVVDDMSISTAVASNLAGITRITIQRTGTFRGNRPRKEGQTHSGRIFMDSLDSMKDLGLPQATSLSDLMEAEAVLIPGTPSIEQLPSHLRHKPQYTYTGPLLIRDYLAGPAGSLTTDLAPVEKYLERHAGQPIVYVTFGTIAKPFPALQRCLRKLLTKGTPVISNILVDDLKGCAPLYFYSRYLPMHLICSRASLVVHHCGSGTYHYPLLHKVRSIVVGTRCYDRDDVAARLEELNGCKYIDPDIDSDNFETNFENAVALYLDSNSQESINSNCALNKLSTEIRDISELFRFDEMLQALVRP